MPTIFLVRHPITKLNNGKRFWGKTDIQLSEEGLRHAEKLRDRLATQKIKAVYTSTLSRTRLTGETIASKHKLNPVSCPELDELNFGWVEGLTFDEIKKQNPDFAEVLMDWRTRPRFPGGESLDELDERVQQFVRRLQKHKAEDAVVVVAHAGTFCVMICRLMGMKLECWHQIQVSLGSLSTIELYPQGARLTLLNDVSHLKEAKSK